MPFFTTVSVKATDREDAIRRVRDMGPGTVAVSVTSPLPHGFLAVTLTHLSRAGQRMGYTTIVTRPDDE
ncbi:hypothetical protein IVB14_12970 [Bradyrhizobium sp. 180]|uniref:hypothetical protein n=1 Tax=Bradyrhizobium sp. 180 TaxID=2782650 RepID=UPI001FFBFBDF|nr:hypothetical protein [Bradyrhizobium sp. 180]MCK1491303.1 hypothetical protein [Bradyrhizobium sp. 180]